MNGTEPQDPTVRAPNATHVDDASAPARDSGAAGPPETAVGAAGEREVAIGWPVVAMIVVALLVAGMGALFGRQIRQRAQTAPATAQTGAEAALPGGVERRVIEMGDVSGGSITFDAGQPVIATAGNAAEVEAREPIVIESDQTRAPEGEVVELPRKDHPLLGKPAADFTMTRVDTGVQVSLSSLAGRPVLVNFWATWCPPCRAEMPWFQALYDKHRAAGLEVLAVDAGERVPPDMVEDQVRRFGESMGITFPLLLGENTYQVQREWSVFGLPATFLVGRDGTVVDYHAGEFPNQATLEHRLQAILEP